MKALLVSTLLFILSSLAQAQQAPTEALDLQHTASWKWVGQNYPALSDPGSRLAQLSERVLAQWNESEDWRLKSPDFPRLLIETAALELRLEEQAAARLASQAALAAQYQAQTAEVQRKLAERLAQIRATNYVTPAPAPAPVQPGTRNQEPRTSSTTVISGAGGVYTTHGGAAGGATIINTGAGHYEIRQKGQPTQRVIIATP